VILVLVFLVMADAFGLIGFVLAPVVAAAIQISVRYLLQPPAMTTPPARDFTVAEQEVTALQERLVLTRERFTEGEVQSSPEMASFLQRLDRLVGETDQYFSNGLTKK